MPLTQKELKEKFRLKLAESLLDVKDAKRLGFELLTKEELQKKHSNLTALPGGGFTLPYFDVNGKKLDFFRYRYLEEPERHGFDALAEHKPSRYIQPAGMKPRAYFSPLCEWSEYLARDPEERPVIITEGELKASCVSKHFSGCIGLGGVWNFLDGGSLIKDLADINWESVTVYIAYDSDARSNWQVIAAENFLANELIKRGASIYVVRLPEVEGKKKTGVDDYIVAEGADKFIEICTSSPPWEKSRLLHKLNEKVLYVHDPGLVVEVDSGQRMSSALFTNSVYANFTYEVKTDVNGKERTTVKSAANEWVRWPFRSEVARITYAPGQGRITARNEYNMWEGWGLSNDQVKRGDIGLWNELLDFIFNGERNHRVWFEKWLAYPLQHPGIKLYQAAVIWGIYQGSGKTLIGSTMERIYGRNFREIKDRDLLNSFNEWAQNRQFVMGDEIAGGDKRANSDRMKTMITQRSIAINAKYMPEFEVPDCINYYFTSNHPDSFFLEDQDRRFFIHEVKERPLPQDFYRKYDKWYKSDDVGALAYHLWNLDLTGFDPQAHAPMTKAKEDMISIGKSDLGEWVWKLKSMPESVLQLNGKPLNFTLMTSDELLRVYDPAAAKRVTPNGLAREMRRAGFERLFSGAVLSTKTAGLVRLWAVRDLNGCEKNTKAVAAKYDSERGMAHLVKKGR